MVRADIKPAFEKDNIALAFTMDGNYLPYLAVTLRSIIANRKRGNLDVLVLGDGISAERQQEWGREFEQVEGLSIRFIEVGNLKEDTELKNFRKGTWLTVATCYRLFLPDMLPAYEKILYLDVDIVVRADLSELYNIDMGDAWLAAGRDWYSQQGFKPKHKAWLRKLGFEDWGNYVNGGVVLMNLGELRKSGLMMEMVKAAVDPETVLFDQDALNAYCKGHVKFLDRKWNFCFADEAGNDAAIIHYTGDKPWKCLSRAFAKEWWKYVGADYLRFIDEAIDWNTKENNRWYDEYRKIKRTFWYRFGRSLTKPFRLFSRK